MLSFSLAVNTDARFQVAYQAALVADAAMWDAPDEGIGPPPYGWPEDLPW